jgi:ribosomal peptide maturation radical SAM protein 1
MRLASSPPRTMLGEAVFWGAAFPGQDEEHARILETLSRLVDPLEQIQRFLAPTTAELLDCVREINGFLPEFVRGVLADGPRIVGFSSMCQQTLASIALAREVKRQRPDVLTVLGGANASEPMGSAILGITDAFDLVFSGEADVTFPAFCRDFLERAERPPQRVIRCTPVANLDDVPAPDYSDYYADLQPLRATDPLAEKAPMWLIFESSRGCWWADKSNCAFCGFNAPDVRYRAKSPDRVIAEITDLTARHGVTQLYAADTIMAPDLPTTVLARLAERGSACALSYEVKSNVRESDLDAFVRAGVLEIQPGIESLSSHVLGLMSKGVKALENVRLLRDALSRGIDVIWNLLTTIPGETQEDYEAMVDLLPLLSHLRPPTRWGPIRISRYSPYHCDPGRYGIGTLHPWTAYQLFYGENADRLAHHFSGEYETGLTRDPALKARFDAALRLWADGWLAEGDPPDLSVHHLDDGRTAIRDTRPATRTEIHVLQADEVEALEEVRRPRTVGSVESRLLPALERLVALGFVARHEDELLTLPIEPHLGNRLWTQRRDLIESGACISHP